MKIVIQSDDGDIQKGIVRVEDFDLSNISMKYALMNEVRDAIMLVKNELTERGSKGGVER